MAVAVVVALSVLIYVILDQSETIRQQQSLIRLLKRDAIRGLLCRDPDNPARPTVYRAKK